jgi:hypothetical protein
MRLFGIFLGLWVLVPAAFAGSIEQDLKNCQAVEKITNTCCVSDNPTTCMNSAQKERKANFDQLKNSGASPVALKNASIEMNGIHQVVCHNAVFDCNASCSGFPEMLTKCRTYRERIHYWENLKKDQSTPTAETKGSSATPVLNVVPLDDGAPTVAPESL